MKKSFKRVTAIILVVVFFFTSIKTGDTQENNMNNKNEVQLTISAAMEKTQVNDDEKIVTKLGEELEHRQSVKDVVIAFLDTGIAGSKESKRILAGKNYVEDENIVDLNGHGSEIEEILLNETPENVRILPLKVADKNGKADITAVIKAIEFAMSQKVAIINISLNAVYSENAKKLELVIEKAVNQGIAVVISAGNNAANVNGITPANIESAIVVGALDEDNAIASYSNYGKNVDLYSYGNYNEKSGTSYAAANVSAILATSISKGIASADEVIENYKEQISGIDYLGFYRNKTQVETEKIQEKTENTSYDLGYDIVNLDWRNIDTNTLNLYFANTSPVFVGMFLTSLSEKEVCELEEKTFFLHNEVVVSEMEYAKDQSTIRCVETETYDFFEYCIKEYETEADKLGASITAYGDIYYGSTDQIVFYFSDSSRTTTYQYIISGLTNVYCSGGGRVPVERFRASVYLMTDPNQKTFEAPVIESFRSYATAVQSRVVEWYNAETGAWMGTDYNDALLNTPGENCGAIGYGLSIQFIGVHIKTGYHLEENSIGVYKYGTNDMPKSWNHDIHADGTNNHTTVPNRNECLVLGPQVNFKKVVQCNVHEIHYGGASSWIYNLGKLSNESSVNQYSNRLQLNGPLEYFSGVTTYDTYSPRLIRTENEIVEYVLNPVPNTYKITFDANEGESFAYNDTNTWRWDTYANVTIDRNDYCNVSGFQPRREGYVFEGWYAGNQNGGVKVYNADGTCTNEGTFFQNNLWKYNGNVTLYAHWQRNNCTMTSYHHQWNPNTEIWEYMTTTTELAVFGSIYTPPYSKCPDNYYNYARDWNQGWTVSGDGYFNVYYYPNIGQTGWNPNGGTINAAGTGNGTYASGGGASTLYLKYLYGKKYGTLPEPLRKGYLFTGWQYTSNGSLVNGVNADWKQGAETVVYLAGWDAFAYTIKFDANGGTGNMADISTKYDQDTALTQNQFTKTNRYGNSHFIGWDTERNSATAHYVNGAVVRNLTEEENGVVTLYAIWDDCPGIESKDLYYSLDQAQNGYITEEELLRHATAFDEEDGEIAPGLHDTNSFLVMDYQASDFTNFQHDGSVTETYQAIDSAGNIYAEQITVYITDTTPGVVDTTSDEVDNTGTTRFIDEIYFNQELDYGGLRENSIWKVDLDYRATILSAFHNQKNNTPEQTYKFTHADILEMKNYAKTNGIGKTKRADALIEFYSQYMN